MKLSILASCVFPLAVASSPTKTQHDNHIGDAGIRNPHALPIPIDIKPEYTNTSDPSATYPTPQPSSFAAGSACDGSEGLWNCLDTTWQRCASGRWTGNMANSPGTRCSPIGRVFEIEFLPDPEYSPTPTTLTPTPSPSAYTNGTNVDGSSTTSSPSETETGTVEAPKATAGQAGKRGEHVYAGALTAALVASSALMLL